MSKKRRKLYVCFVDFEKCFDTINRQLLWNTLRNRGVKGKLFTALKSMYNTVKSCIKCNNTRSDFITSTVGLKQGCLASPILFSFFIDELQDIYERSGIRGIQLHPDIKEIFLLMFADDIALMSDTVRGLQQELNILAKFCDDYKLKVNENKSKIVVFNKGGKLSKNEKWLYKNTELDIVNRYCYVGLTFTRQLSLNIMVHDLCVKGRRVLVSLLKSLYDCGQMSKDVYFKIFDTKICPLLLYGAEVWRLERYDDLERCQYYACKRFMCTRQYTSNSAVLGDCARYPMYIETFKRAIKFWLKIQKMPNCRIVKKCYKMMLIEDEYGKINWVTNVRKCLQSNGFGYVWTNQGVHNEYKFISEFVCRLKDMYIQHWQVAVQSNTKLEFYSMFKSDFTFESYLDVLNIRKFRYMYVSFRTGSHCLSIERGRYNNTPRDERICKLCNSNSIEDEFHFLLVCGAYNDIRVEHISQKYITRTNLNKFKILMSSKNPIVIKSIATFLYHAFNRRDLMLKQIESEND